MYFITSNRDKCTYIVPTMINKLHDFDVGLLMRATGEGWLLETIV